MQPQHSTPWVAASSPPSVLLDKNSLPPSSLCIHNHTFLAIVSIEFSCCYLEALNSITVKPLIKDTLKDDKPPNKGHTNVL